MDYKDLKEKPIKRNKKSNTITEQFNADVTTGSMKTRWWAAEDKDVYNYITTIVNGIAESQNYRALMNLRYARLYANQEVLGFGAGLFDRTAASTVASNRVSYNVVKSCVDTAASKIAKMRPRVQALTSDGDWSLQDKAKKLTRYLDGQFEQLDMYEIAATAFVDACVFGTGFVKIFHDGEAVRAERVFPNEVLVDDQEGMYGKPAQMHQIKYIPRETLIEMFRDDAELVQKIKTCNIGLKSNTYNYNTTADLVIVRESWHLPSGPNATDGKHAITIGNATLLCEPYNKHYFPLLKFDWTKKLLGFFGTGLAEELIGIQIEINKLLKNIQRAQHLACVPRVFAEASSQVNAGNFNNEIGSFVSYVGTPPTIAAGQGMPVEVYTHLETLYRRAFEITGISLLSATSAKPSGLNSSLALREYQDIETERFAITAQNYEAFFLKAAEIIIDISKDLYENKKDLKVFVKGSKFVETIPWKQVDMADDIYSLRLFPVNMLPQKPEGRLAKIQELIQAGFFTKEEAFALLDFPDLEALSTLKNAPYEITMQLIEKMLIEGKYTPPEPFMNLSLSRTLTQYAYLKAKLKDMPEERLELLRRFMEDCLTLEQLAMQGAMDANTAASPMTSPGPLQPATPAAPPVSDLLPLPTV